MRKEKISTSQGYLLIITFIMGTSFVITSYFEALQDTWASILLAIAFATPMVLIYANIMNRFSGMDLYQILELVFGKLIGKVISLLYTFYFFHIGALCIRSITEYIQVVSFPETPQYFTAVFLGLLIIYILKSGLEVIARVNKFLFPILIIITLLTIAVSINKMKPAYLLPILYTGWDTIFRASLSPFAFPLGETVVFMTILNAIRIKKNSTKIYLTGIYSGGLLLLIVALRNILILGFPNLSSSSFPSHYALTLIDIGNFIRGIELIVSIVLLVSGFVKASVCLFASSVGICRILNFQDYKWVSAPLGLLMISLSFILFDNTMHIVEWLDVYKYYAFPFQVIIPILLFIFSIFKKKTSA